MIGDRVNVPHDDDLIIIPVDSLVGTITKHLDGNRYEVKSDDGRVEVFEGERLTFFKEPVVVVHKKKRIRQGNIISPLPSRCKVQECRKQILAIANSLFGHSQGSKFFDIDVKDILTLMVIRMGLTHLTREAGEKILISSSWDGTNLGNMPFFMWGLKLVDTRSKINGKAAVIGETVQSRNNCLPCGIAFAKDTSKNVDEYMKHFIQG